MKQSEFLGSLRRALSGLPQEERDNAMRYYEDYFLDAVGVDEEEIVRQLGDPLRIADDILKDYRELTVRDRGHGFHKQSRADDQGAGPRWRGIHPLALLILVILAVPIGIPLVFGFFAVVAGLITAGVALLFSMVLIGLAIPFALLAAGVALIVFSCLVLSMPPSAVLTFGVGLCCIALGLLSALLIVKLAALFIPPLVRGLVALLRWPIDRLRGVKK